MNQETVTIRAAVLEDGPTIFKLAKEFATSFAVEEAACLASLRGLLGDCSVCLMVAETEGALVGYVLAFDHLTFFANGRAAWIEEIFVIATLRKHGIGRQLMDAVTKWACDRQCRIISLATRRADLFYRALGYEESATYFRKIL